MANNKRTFEDFSAEHDDVAARYSSVCQQHTQATKTARQLATEREQLRRRVIELKTRMQHHQLAAWIKQLAEAVPTLNNGCLFQCAICQDNFPCAIAESDLESTDLNALPSLGSLTLWLGSWQMRFACEHSVCRICYVRSLREILVPSTTHTLLGARCPICKSPRQLMSIDSDPDDCCSDDEYLDIGHPLHVTTAASEPEEEDPDHYSPSDDSAISISSGDVSPVIRTRTHATRSQTASRAQATSTSTLTEIMASAVAHINKADSDATPTTAAQTETH
jgi:hypothetical protein